MAVLGGGHYKSIKFAVLIFCFTLTVFFSYPALAASTDGIVETTFFGNLKDDGGGCGVYTILNSVVDILSIGIGILAIIGITIVGIKYLTAKGDVAQTKKAKTRLLQIVIGLVAYVLLYAGVQWLLPGGKLNTSQQCTTISDQELAQLKEQEQKAKQEAAAEKSASSAIDSKESSDSDFTIGKDVNKNTLDGAPSCKLAYNSVTGELSFSTTKNAVKYAIAKNGKSPSYKSKNYIYYPGEDRINSTKNFVSINYVGYVKNSKGDVAKCNKTVSVSRGAAAVAYGKTFMGTKYCHWWNKNRKNWWGQKHLVCTDCSGFTGGIYSKLLGYHISRDDDDQCASSYSKTYKVSGRNSTSGAKVGDIVCFGKTGKNGSVDYTHVAFYLGRTSKGYVKILQMGGGHGKVNIDTRKKWVKIVRVIGSN